MCTPIVARAQVLSHIAPPLRVSDIVSWQQTSNTPEYLPASHGSYPHVNTWSVQPLQPDNQSWTGGNGLEGGGGAAGSNVDAFGVSREFVEGGNAWGPSGGQGA